MIEFLLVLAALVVGGFVAMWLHAAFYDFVDKWKIGIRLQEERDRRIRREAAAKVFSSKPPIMDLEEARLPPMAPIVRLARASRYGMDHEPPAGPPDDWEKRPSRSKAARMLD